MYSRIKARYLGFVHAEPIKLLYPNLGFDMRRLVRQDAFAVSVEDLEERKGIAIEDNVVIVLQGPAPHLTRF
jgi:hypothetical protein